MTSISALLNVQYLLHLVTLFWPPLNNELLNAKNHRMPNATLLQQLLFSSLFDKIYIIRKYMELIYNTSTFMIWVNANSLAFVESSEPQGFNAKHKFHLLTRGFLDLNPMNFPPQSYYGI